MNQHKKQNVHRVPPAPRDAERGQAIVLMALMMISLLAVLGLAIDGGGMFAKWRDLQYATDSAVVAAAYQRCADESPTYNSIMTVAHKSAEENGFVHATDVTGDGQIDTEVLVYWRESLDAQPNLPAEVYGDDRFVMVRINTEKPAYFINVVYKNPLTLSNTALGFCVERFDPTTVPAIMALGSSCQGGNELELTLAELIVEGGAHSNGELKPSGCGQDCSISGGADAHQGMPPDPSAKVDYPDGSNPSAPKKDNPVDHISVSQFAPPIGGNVAGVYWSDVPISHRHHVTDGYPGFNSGNRTWKPNETLLGLYYVDGNVDIGPGDNWDQTHGVTIVATGTINVRTGPGKNMKHYYPQGTGSEFPGIILFTEAGGSSCTGPDTIDVTGSTMFIQGVILAPNGRCTTSLSSTDIYGAVICYTLKVSGSSGKIIYEPGLLPPVAPKVSIAG